MNQSFRHESMESWIHVNHPESHRRILTPEISDRLLMMAKSADPPALAPSMACLTGQDADSAKNNSDWKNNPLLGAVNLAQMARNAAGYNPTNLDDAGATSTQYEDFLRRLVTCPLYNIKLSDRVHVKRETSDWNDVINSIADTFEGIAEKDKGSIVKGLKNLAQAASSKMKTEQTQAVFVQNAMEVDKVISLYLYSSKTSFYEDKGKGYDTKSNEFDVLRLRLEFQQQLWPDWWEKVKKAFDGSVDDWINDNKTTTEGTSPIPALS